MKFKNLITHTFNAMCATSVLFGATMAHAQEYPTKQIELVVPFSPGGGTDLVARAFADTAKKYLPQPMGVVNKTGGGGAVGLSDIALARPDGYKIGIGTSEINMLPHMGLVAFKADDFVPIARLNAEPSAISVNAESPWKTYEEFMAYAKANPGKVRVGNSGTGAIWHLAAEALGDKAGVKFSHVPYEGANPAVTALLGNHIEAVTVSPAEVVNHVRAGKIRLLAVMADKRSPAFDQVPTLKEKGLDVVIMTWRGIMVSKKTPQNVQDILRTAAKNTTNDPAFKEVLTKMNLTSAYIDAPEFKTFLEKDNAFYKALMTKLGIAK